MSLPSWPVHTQRWIVNLLLGAFLCFQPSLPQTWAAPQASVTYGEAGGTKLKALIYGSDPKQKKPGIILLHGGGWVGGSPQQMEQAGGYLATQGYVCFSVSYRLVNEAGNRYPTQLDDVQRAVRWVRANAETYGVLPEKIGAIGSSAGGHLAALLGVQDTRDNSIADLAKYSSKVQCVVTMGAPTDFRPYLDPDAKREGRTSELLEPFLGSLPEFVANYTDASPTALVKKDSAPMLVIHGTKDDIVPVEQAHKLHKALQDAGATSKLLILPNSGHEPAEADLLSVMQELSAFLEKHLKSKTP